MAPSEEVLYQALVNLGDYYCLKDELQATEIEPELMAVENWRPLPSPGGTSPRWVVDLVTEGQPGVATETLHQVPAIGRVIDGFLPFVKRARLIKLGHGGFVSIEEGGRESGKSIRLISALTHCDIGQFCFLYDDQRVFLEKYRLYFLNTKKDHTPLSFGPSCVILEIDLRLEFDAVALVSSHAFSR